MESSWTLQMDIPQGSSNSVAILSNIEGLYVSYTQDEFPYTPNALLA